MTPFIVLVAAFLLGLLMFGFAFWTPIYAIPLAVLFLVVMGAYHLMRRRTLDPGVRELRDQERATRGTQFTERDRETLYERDRHA